jgi:hypothetical protein
MSDEFIKKEHFLLKIKTSCKKGQSYKKSFLEINFWNLKKQIRLYLSTAKKIAIAIEEILRWITKGDHNELWSKRETSKKKLQEGRAWTEGGGVRRAGNGTKFSKTGEKKNTLRKTTAKKRNAKDTYTPRFVKNFLLLVVAAPSSRGIRTVRN